MRRIFFIMALMLTCIMANAQKEGDKGPITVETPYFKVDVPKGWYIHSIMNKEVPCWLTIRPEVDPAQRGNFGFQVNITASKYSTAEEYIGEAMKQYGEGSTKRMPDFKVGKTMMAHTFFDEGYGTSQHLIAPLNSVEGGIKISVSEYALKHKDIKTILKSLVIK